MMYMMSMPLDYPGCVSRLVRAADDSKLVADDGKLLNRPRISKCEPRRPEELVWPCGWIYTDRRAGDCRALPCLPLVPSVTTDLSTTYRLSRNANETYVLPLGRGIKYSLFTLSDMLVEPNRCEPGHSVDAHTPLAMSPRSVISPGARLLESTAIGLL